MEKKLREQLPTGRFEGVSAKRSRAMAAVKSQGNKTTEQRLRFGLVSAGVSGWRMHARELPGSPDFLFPASRLAIFVDGCFWHGCANCGHFPKTNSGFWRAKILRNRERDRRTSETLAEDGYQILRFWEHELASDLSRCVQTVVRELASSPCPAASD